MHYTDDHARLTAKLVLALIAFLCAGLFFVNGFLKRWTLPVVGLVLMVVSGVILGLIYPMVVQSFQVKPNEPDRERSYIAKHIEATRTAFGIDDAEVTEYEAVTQVSQGQLKEDAEALPGIRLIDPAVVAPTFENQQQLRGYYSFPEVLDVDRYVIDGKETDAVVAAREINVAGLPDQNWNNLHTVYTHGYGLVAAYGNRRSSSGDPEWIEKNLPPEGDLPNYEGRIYFGEQSSTFAIVGREEGQPPIEFDTPGGGQGTGEVNNTYAGTGGVAMGDLFSRMLFATHFMDLDVYKRQGVVDPLGPRPGGGKCAEAGEADLLVEPQVGQPHRVLDGGALGRRGDRIRTGGGGQPSDDVLGEGPVHPGVGVGLAEAGHLRGESAHQALHPAHDLLDVQPPVRSGGDPELGQEAQQGLVLAVLFRTVIAGHVGSSIGVASIVQHVPSPAVATRR